MKISTLVNLPWTLLALFCALISYPQSFKILSSALAIQVYSLKWIDLLSGRRETKGFTLGNMILISPKADSGTLPHELIHITQFQKYPFVFPILYLIEHFKNGYKNNLYEIQAYNQQKLPR